MNRKDLSESRIAVAIAWLQDCSLTMLKSHFAYPILVAALVLLLGSCKVKIGDSYFSAPGIADAGNGSNKDGGAACVPKDSCKSHEFQCGTFVDSCGETKNCGTCTSTNCVDHKCPGCVANPGCGSATCGSDNCGTNCGSNSGHCQARMNCSTTDGSPGSCVVNARAGNPDGQCSLTLPYEALPEDTSSPTSVVGTGSESSCTYEKLAAAIAKGGVITFKCGENPVTITVTSTLNLLTDRHTVIDGGNKITLDGGGSRRILSWNSPNWLWNENVFTLQHITISNGKATPTELIPYCDEPCSQGYNDGQGGAIFMRDGAFRAIDVIFTDNQAAELGPDTGGGAVYLFGHKLPAYISNCTFRNNRASNAGGIGSLFAEMYIYDSLFEDNAAVGHGANSDNKDECSCYREDTKQYQVGSGGNGGAIYSDGVAKNITICGTQVRNNSSGAFGAAVFFTSNEPSTRGALTIIDSLMFGNTQARVGWEWLPGISTNANTVDPVNSDIK